MNLSIFLGGLRPGSRGWLHPRTKRPVGRLWQRFSCPSATHDCVRGVREKARKALVRKGSTSAFKRALCTKSLANRAPNDAALPELRLEARLSHVRVQNRHD